jgi:K+-sensing histidine kinase KdpD
VRVSDTGIGIKEEDRSKIFQMFGKLEATASINTTGIGLGLSICKKIVEALDGYIYLEENESASCGTTFVFAVKLDKNEFSLSDRDDEILTQSTIKQGTIAIEVIETECGLFGDNLK